MKKIVFWGLITLLNLSLINFSWAHAAARHRAPRVHHGRSAAVRYRSARVRHHHARWPHRHYHAHHHWHRHIPRYAPAWGWHAHFWIAPDVFVPAFMVHVGAPLLVGPAPVIVDADLVASWRVVYAPSMAPVTLKIYYRDGYYWARHYDHHDAWSSDLGSWWCPVHQYYMDWGYPRAFVDHYQEKFKSEIVVNPEDDYLIKINDIVYYRHGDEGKADHYDRFDSSKNAFYCFTHQVYFQRVNERDNGNYEYVEDYDLFWSEDDQIYVIFTPSEPTDL